MSNIKDKLDKIISKEPSQWVEKAEWRVSNETWLDKSAKIAIKILREIRKQGITQIDLARKLNISPQQVNKIVKGRENLTLQTISNIETVLGVCLSETPEYQFESKFESTARIFYPGYTVKKNIKTSIEDYNKNFQSCSEIEFNQEGLLEMASYG